MPITYSTEKRDQAKSLREQGKTLREISRKLNISLSTTQLWVKEVKLSEIQRDNIASKHKCKLFQGRNKFIEKQKHQKNQRESKIFLQAKNEIELKKTDSFFILGLALYWAEGFKKDHSLGFVNSDPIMIQKWLKWIKTYCEITKADIRLRVQINEIYRQNITAVQLYWSKLLKIPTTQFQTPYYQSSKSKQEVFDPNYFGLLRIRVVGTRLIFIRILGWLEGLKQASY